MMSESGRGFWVAFRCRVRAVDQGGTLLAKLGRYLRLTQYGGFTLPREFGFVKKGRPLSSLAGGEGWMCTMLGNYAPSPDTFILLRTPVGYLDEMYPFTPRNARMPYMKKGWGFCFAPCTDTICTMCRHVYTGLHYFGGVP